MTCTSCHQHVPFVSLAEHQPAIASAASMDSTVDEGETGLAGASNAASTSALSASAASAAAAAAPAAAQSSSSAGAAATVSDLLPPLVPPCNASQVCPNGCEDPNQPGSVSCNLLGAGAAALLCAVAWSLD